jgi:hypothetical protein
MISIIVYLILDTVKRVGDLDLKLPTLCITKKDVMVIDLLSLANICLQLNTKLAGVNYKISVDSWYRFFFWFTRKRRKLT